VFRKSKFLYTPDESEFAHDCSGNRITVRGRANQFLTDPASATLVRAWRDEVQDAQKHGQFAAIFDDTAVSTGLISSLPCGFDPNVWIFEHVVLISALDSPVLFNGLGDGQLAVSGRRGPDAGYGMSPVVELAASRSAIGGSFEDCYVSPDRDNGFGKTVNAYWRRTEETENAMARLGKLFVCNERVDRKPMDAAYDMRAYAEASMLLTYDPASTIVRQQFQTPSWFNLGPEMELVPMSPVQPAPDAVDALRTPGGTYAREYRDCYIAGSPVGPCAAVVNPDSHDAHAFPYSAYHHTMTLQGSGIIDGGQIGISGPAPPSMLAPMTGVVVFQ